MRFVSWKKLLVFVLLIVFGGGFFVFVSTGVSAQTLGDDFGTGYLNSGALPSDDIRVVIINFVRVALGVLGVIFFAIVVYGGFLWMTARGNEQQLDKARKIIINAVAGLVVIFMSFALVTFIFNILNNTRNASDGPGACVEGSISGCFVCVGGTYSGNYNPSLPGCSIAGSSLVIREMETAHGGDYPSKDVYLCSSTQARFNNDLNQSTIDGNVRLVTSDGTDVPGDIISRRRSIEFDPDVELDENTDYEMRYRNALEDTSGLFLTGCVPSLGCSVSGNDIVWKFSTGNTMDDSSPDIVSTNPISDLLSARYPDRNVDRDEIINVTFNESVRIATIDDGLGRPIAENIILEELESQGTSYPTPRIIDSSELLVYPNSNGFDMVLESPNLFEPFTWYRVTVQNIQDLCGNTMSGPVTWEFQTNDKSPGVGSFYPKGNNICPSVGVVTLTFNTSMYYDSVSIDIIPDSPTNSPAYGAGSLNASTLSPTPPYRVQGVNGVWSVDPATDFKVYTFTPTVAFDENTSYYVNIKTNRVINTDGDLLEHSWVFNVSDVDTCACSPYISSINPSQGLLGQCVTVLGQCFLGAVPDNPSDPRYASLESITFNGLPAVIGSVGPNYVSTSINSGGVFGVGDTLFPDVTIKYNDPLLGEMQTNNNVVSYYVDSNDESTGPCLFDVSPPQACFTDKVSLTGMRFGDDPGVGNRSTEQNNITFTDGGVLVSDENVRTWASKNISVYVPTEANDGGVNVTAGGQRSNSIPFDLQCGVGSSCSSSTQACVPDSGICAPGLSCNTSTCTCEVVLPPGTPAVVNDSSCDTNTQSPSPYTGNTETCINAQVSARFNMDMDQSTFTTSNITVNDCGSGDSDGLFDPNSCSVDPESGSIVVINEDTDSEGFIFRPDVDFTSSTWYRVTIKKEVLSSEGVGLLDDYVWEFKTRVDANRCDISSVRVIPDNKILNKIAGTQVYTGIPQSQACTILDPVGLLWEWNSSAPDVATIDDVSVAKSTATAVSAGETNISASTEGLSDYAKLSVVIDPTACSSDLDCTTGDYACPGSVCNLDIGKCTPVIDKFLPEDGAVGNWLTIQGCMFGNDYGDVTFVGDTGVDSDDVSAVRLTSACGDTWTNEQIIVEIPNKNTLEIDDDATDGPIRVTTRYGMTTQSDSSFDVNDRQYPGLCALRPSMGKVGDTVSIVGNNMGDSVTPSNSFIFTAVDNPDTAQVSWSSIVPSKIVSWGNTNASVVVPKEVDGDGNITKKASSGNTVLKLLDEVSNPLYFDMSPYITKLSPSSGPYDQWVTVSGGNFGDKPGVVTFAGSKYVCQGGSNDGLSCGSSEDCLGDVDGVCVNDPSDDVVAEFPGESCANSWTDSYIIVKVPKNAKSGLVKVTTNPNVTPSGSLTSKDVDSKPFTVNTNPVGAKLCKLNPDNGYEGDSFTASGDRFGSTQSNTNGNSQLVFTDNDAGKVNSIIETWSTDSIDAIVPVFGLGSDSTMSVQIEKPEVVGRKCTGVSVSGNCVGGEWEDVVEMIPSNSLPFTVKSLGITGPPPNITGHTPYGTSVCRNSLVTVDFDSLMNPLTLNTNTVSVKVKKNLLTSDSDGCTLAYNGSGSLLAKSDGGSFIGKVFRKISNLISSVFAQELADYWCPVDGSVGSYELRESCSLSVECEEFDGCSCEVDGEEVCTVENGSTSCSGDPSQTRMKFTPFDSFEPDADYSVTVSGGLSGVRGIDNGVMETDYSWNFTTRDSMCSISYVSTRIVPPGDVASEDVFMCAGRDDCPGDVENGQNNTNNTPGNQHKWIAEAFDSSTPPYTLNVDYLWSAVDVDKLYDLSDLDTSEVTVTPSSRGGSATVFVGAYDSDDPSVGSATSTISVSTFLCDNPWPAYGEAFPFYDEETDFELSYCRDQGSGRVCVGSGGEFGDACGTSTDCAESQTCIADPRDDLPDIGSPVTSYAEDDPDIVKEFFFLSPETPRDSIAIRVYKNQDFLSPKEWYRANVSNVGSTQNIEIDGYKAIRDGRTVYVSAAKELGGKYGAYMYIMSYNNNADPRTVKIYNQLLDNWKFTTDITDLNQCDGDMKYCTSDADCTSEEGLGLCLVDATKIRRDLQRIVDLGSISNALKEYKEKNGSYPELLSGSFIQGQTTSRWPVSWSSLGTLLGFSLPKDPVNEFSYCPDGYDDVACWNDTPTDDNPSFVCADGSYIYQYVSSNSGLEYALYANMEYDDIEWNFGSKVGDADGCKSYYVGQ